MGYPRRFPKKQAIDVQLCGTRDIRAPIETIFEMVTDWDRNLVDDDPPVLNYTITSRSKHGKGVTSHWTAMNPHTHDRFEWDEEILHYDPPYQFAFKVIHAPGIYEGIFTLTENPDQTVHVELCETFYYPADVPESKRNIDSLLTNLKRLTEQSPDK